MLSDEQATPDQLHALRALTPEQRWQVSQRLYWSVRRLKSAYLSSLHPEWSPERLDTEVRRIFLCARS